jgi:putative transcriptional regulator
VARLEALGGALLASGEAAETSPGCLAGALARIAVAERPAATPAPAPDPTLPLPAPLRARLGIAACDIRWRFLLPGLSDYRLDGFEGEEVRLLRARPGLRILQHTHAGDEATLILTGQMRDGDRVYARGDVALADETHDHHPQIVGSEPCVCLVVLSGPMRFTGRVGRALNLFS